MICKAVDQWLFGVANFPPHSHHIKHNKRFIIENRAMLQNGVSKNIHWHAEKEDGRITPVFDVIHPTSHFWDPTEFHRAQWPCWWEEDPMWDFDRVVGQNNWKSVLLKSSQWLVSKVEA
jgi:hypothetical protein